MAFTLNRMIFDTELSMTFDAVTMDKAVSQIEEKTLELRAALDKRIPAKATIQDIPSIARASTPTEAILMLHQTPWGIRPKTIREIMEALNANGMYLPITTLSSILLNSTRKGRIRRWKEGKNFVYCRADGQ